MSMSSRTQSTWTRRSLKGNELDNLEPEDSLVDSSIRKGVEEDKCVVAQYRTTYRQKYDFENYLTTCSKDHIPIEWIIDIADETNGWFYGTAYHFNDKTHMLHVMVPDKQNPSFDGEVLLDHRTVHLIECVDGKTDALFNKIVRDSVMRVKWEVDWFEEDPAAPDSARGRWVASSARYYIRIANQLLVEDDDEGEGKGFVMLTADINVRLKKSLKERGQEDFNRLVIDGSVLSTPEVLAAAHVSMSELASRDGGLMKNQRGGVSESDKYHSEDVTIKRLAEMSKVLKDRLADLLDEKEKTFVHRMKIAKLFRSFSMTGDLDAGLKLLIDADEVNMKDEKRRNYALNIGEREERDESDSKADEAWTLVLKLEKSAQKLSTGEELKYRRRKSEYKL